MSHSRTSLERRARVLLLAYPAEYRRERAEEMIGTLLEATPPGRSFPSARDAWGLIAGGRHARAARNGGLSARANLRLTLLLASSFYLGQDAAMTLVNQRGQWFAVVSGIFTLALALAPWLRSRAATTALIIPGGGLYAWTLLGLSHPSVPSAIQGVDWDAPGLIAVGALVALSGGSPRLPRSWVWLSWLAPAVVLAVRLSPFHGGIVRESNVYLYTLVALAAVVVCWLATDARPALALCVAELLTLTPSLIIWTATAGSWSMAAAELMSYVPWLAVIAPIMLPAVWLLRRQTAPRPRPVR
ncbi:MAG TPA: hypothetical protein VIZ43_03895 [Trebonia sp.]